jgi:hypothetical protein
LSGRCCLGGADECVEQQSAFALRSDVAVYADKVLDGAGVDRPAPDGSPDRLGSTHARRLERPERLPHVIKPR